MRYFDIGPQKDIYIHFRTQYGIHLVWFMKFEGPALTGKRVNF